MYFITEKKKKISALENLRVSFLNVDLQLPHQNYPGHFLKYGFWTFYHIYESDSLW